MRERTICVTCYSRGCDVWPCRRHGRRSHDGGVNNLGRRFLFVISAFVLAAAPALGMPAAAAARPAPSLASVARASVVQRLERGTTPVIVRLRSPMTATALSAVTEKSGVAKIGHHYVNVPAFSASMNLAAARRLAASGVVRSIELDVRIKIAPPSGPRAATNSYGPGGPSPIAIRTADPGIGAAATAFHLNGDIAGDGLKTYSKGDAVIAIVDSGVDTTHPDLDGKKVLAFQTFVSYPDSSCPPLKSTPYDDNGHGTHVASIAAGEGDANAAHTGVAPGAAIVSLKIFDCTGSGYVSDADLALDWMITNRAKYGIDVANLSWGSYPTDGTDLTSILVNRATAAGIIVAAAAGNAGDGLGSVSSPGSARYAVTVGAATQSTPAVAPSRSSRAAVPPLTVASSPTCLHPVSTSTPRSRTILRSGTCTTRGPRWPRR